MTSMTEDILARLAVLQPQIEGIKPTLPSRECKIDPEALPAFINLPVGAIRASSSSDKLIVTRTFLLVLAVSIIPDGKDEARQVAYEDCYPFLDSVPAFFAKHPRLDLNGDPLKGITNASLALNDEGPQKFAWGGDVFSAILFRAPIEYQRSF